ncbi:sensor histidine kinase [Sulfuriflexus mobilis]|uniref:sensor histidine kinase n=1 Tax=Sulfuriflexus mobilis TaxID=1811807 RepID=UPI000F83E25B|nr:ATP-binding protein [Sulfuriflexus mobilis]
MNTATTKIQNDDDDMRVSIQREQTRLLYTAIPFSVVMTLFNAGLLSYIEWPFIQHSHVIVWMTMMIVIAIVRSGFAMAYARSTNSGALFWLQAFVVTTLINASIWGGAMIYLFPHNNIIGQALLAIITAGMAAGSITTLSYLRITGIGYISIILAPVAIQFYSEQHQYAFLLFILTILFYLTILASSLRMYRNTRQNIELSYKSHHDAIAIREAMILAERANEAKSRFLSSMSHELRTPLNAILGFSQILQIDTKNPLSREQDKHVKEIMVAGDHLLGLINKVLDLSYLEQGEFTVTLEDVSVLECTKESLSFVEKMAQKKGITIINNIKASHHVFADPLRLKEVLINLLGNAIKFNRVNGSVTLDSSVDGSNVCIEVRDTGIGIKATDIEELFKPFHRLDTVNNVDGTGIGLSLSQQLLHRMNGEIGVKSVHGEGSLFWVKLPASQP